MVGGAEDGHPVQPEVVADGLQVGHILLQAELAEVGHRAGPPPAARVVEEQAPALRQRMESVPQPVGVRDDDRLVPLPERPVVELEPRPDENETLCAFHVIGRRAAPGGVYYTGTEGPEPLSGSASSGSP